MSEPSGTIVIGVDGSAHSHRALAWALDEARLRGWRCILVHAFDYGLTGMSPYPGNAPQLIAEDAQELLDRNVAWAKESGVPVEGRLEFGSASRALVEAARGADLLVVGSRGRGGVAGALLGSVSSACVHHAACPVVVVPPTERSHETEGVEAVRAGAR